MRRLSKRTQYSLRALYGLTRSYKEGPKLIVELAAEESIPKKFLEQILLALKDKGLVDSKKGRGGGYFLARPPEEITLGYVIRMIEGPLAPLPCASETAFRKCDECADVATCGTRIVMRDVRNAMAKILDRTTLQMICQKMDEAAAKKSSGEAELMFHI